MAQDYNQTLNLPTTDFPMRAGLPQKEPAMLEKWETEHLYKELIRKNEGKPTYILHDGPPYANGDIHLGTALNKVLKDIIVKYKNMSGYQSNYVPGWDTHGLPIELKAMKKAGIGNGKTSMSPVELRKICREFALSYVDNQRNQFKRLGVWGDFDNPYLTLKPEFEARQIEVFGEMAKKGYIYKGLKPVYWCPHCGTALAEAEIEYAEDPCYSIYVKFAVKNDVHGVLEKMGADVSKTYFVIWTTTTWTLPANVAICLGPEYDYCLVKANGEYYVMARELADIAMQAAKITDYELIGSVKGSELEYITCQHPFIDRESLVILGDHVTLESGTGCVHTAPGHGIEDFEVCVQNYKELPIVVPVDSEGKLTEEAGPFAGLTTNDANKAIAQALEDSGNLLAIQKIIHQYPHCWRCKDPVIFRATQQWFCSVDGFKEQAIEAVKSVKWIPDWGEGRITGMIRDRSDWCISRQRTWGVPIPIFYCKDCGKYVVNDDSIHAVSELFREKGSDAWYTESAEQILPKNFTCPHCGGKHFTKETDIMDVWFDSGCTHAAVLDQRPDLKWPCDLYLEGNDQYRGWFQSSLLTSVAWRGQAPYKAVCTHGWVVDGEGRKMSKSLGNGIAPEDIINEYGADILRLWVASSDYHADIKISKDILKQLSEQYRKIRNTARFILGTISDFDPNTDAVSYDQLEEMDKWALMRLDDITKEVNEAYEAFDYHIVFHAIHNFCVLDMSNFYLDVLKDRLYVEKTDSLTRRAAQTTVYHILVSLTKLIAPILSFTAEEIWSYIPKTKDMDARSVILNEIDKASSRTFDDAFRAKWDRIHALRDTVNKALEDARANKSIGKSLEACVTLTCDGELYDFVSSVSDCLAQAFIVSQVKLVRGQAQNAEAGEPQITISRAEGEKCERCWMYSHTVGSVPEHPTLCKRCADILK